MQLGLLSEITNWKTRCTFCVYECVFV